MTDKLDRSEAMLKLADILDEKAPIAAPFDPYADVREFMDRALATGQRMTLTFGNAGKAVYFRHRFYKMRIDDRKAQSAMTLGENSYSVYNDISIRVEGNAVIFQRDEPPTLTVG